VTALKLLQVLVLRSLRQERLLSLLSVLGVALGIALFVGVKLSSDRALGSFESDIRGPNPSVTHEITSASGIDFDEAVYRHVRMLEEKSLPVIRAGGLVKGRGETIEILGLDIIRTLRYVQATEGTPGDLEAVLRQPAGVIVPASLAKRLSLGKNDTITVSLYDRDYDLTVVSVTDAPSVPSGTAVMDIGNFQEHFGRQGVLTRIDLPTDPATANLIENSLPDSLVIRQKEEAVRNQEALIASFRQNLHFISLMAILVGMFLLYNTVFISIVKRRTEIGILRSLGAGKGTVLSLFALQGLLLGLAGSLLGIALGQLSATLSVAAVQKTVTSMYSRVFIGTPFITLHDALKALLLGLSVSCAASLIPAREASRLSPNESSREGSFEMRYRRHLIAVSCLGSLLILAGAAISYVEYLKTPFTFPYLAHSGILLIILGFTLLSPAYLLAVMKAVRRPVIHLFGAIGRISLGEMQGSLYRFSIALMSVAVSCALIVALLTLIYSFRHSLQRWINSTILADVYIKPASCVSNYCFQPLSEEVASLVEKAPEVAGVDRYRVLNLDISGTKVITAFGDAALTRRLAGKAFVEARKEERLREVEEGKAVAVSLYLAARLGLSRGDTVELPTPSGRQAFTVSDTFVSYSTTSGFLYLDRRWLREYWGLDDATQLTVYLKEGQDPAAFIGRLRTGELRGYSLQIMNNRELRQMILGIFDRSFAITYAIEIIATVVSLIGVVSILIALTLEKRREMSILRYLGGSWRQIEQKVLLSAGLAGAAGTLLGLVMGLMMSLIFVRVVNRVSFGWEVDFQIPGLPLGLTLLAVFLTTVVVAVIPAKAVRRFDPTRYISRE